MDPSPSPCLNQLGYYIMDAKIIEMVIKYNRLHKIETQKNVKEEADLVDSESCEVTINTVQLQRKIILSCLKQ